MTTLRDRPAPSLLLDWLVAIAGIWVIAGLYVDGRAHLTEPLETFFTPWHALVYSGGAFAALVFAITSFRNVRQGYPFLCSLPEGYQQILVAAPVGVLGGVLDLLWHLRFGLEQGIDTLVSPTHMILIGAIFFVFAGPVRSAIIRKPATLVGQLPALLGMAVVTGTILFVTQFDFYNESLLKDAPASPGAFSEDQLTLLVIAFYKHIFGSLVVIWQTLILIASTLYLVVNLRLRAGALLIFVLLEKLLISMSFARTPSELILVTLASAIAGFVAEVIAARWNPCPERPGPLRLLGLFVPMAFYGAYYALAVPLFGGTWWDTTFLFGAIAYSGLAGLSIAQLYVSTLRVRTAA